MVYTSTQPPISFPVTDLFSFYFSRPPGHERRFPSTKPIFQSSTSPYRSYTYAQLFDLSRWFATTLQRRLKFKPGQTLALVTPNDIDIAPILLGAWYAGGVVTPANPQYTISELIDQLRDSAASAILTHVTVLETVLAVAEQLKIPHCNVLVLGEAEDTQKRVKHWRSFLTTLESSFPNPPVEISDPKTTLAFLPYSSGTTGTPKGVSLTHFNLTSNIFQCANTHKEYFSWNGGEANTIPGVPAAARYDEKTGEGGDKILAVLPVFHVYGMLCEVLLPLWMGITSFISPRFDMLDFCNSIEQHNITMVYIVPPIALGLMRKAEVLKQKFGVGWGESMRICFCAAAPLGREFIEGLWKEFGWRTIQAYGLSECSPGVTQQHLGDFWDGRGTVGTLVSGIEMRLVRLDGDGEEVGDGEEGELVARGPNVFRGYLNRDEATKGCLSSDGWFRTGDVGYVEKATGRVFITDRVKELIKYKGFQVAPAELEAVLLECPIVEDVGVIGVPDEREQTEVPRAFCVRKGGLTNLKDGDDKIVMEWLERRVTKYLLGYRKMQPFCLGIRNTKFWSI
jgi:4-coumarate--CoA ligase